MNKDVVKYGLIGAAIYFAWPYVSEWFKGLGIGGGSGSGKFAGMCYDDLMKAAASASPEDKQAIYNIMARYKEPKEVLESMAAKGDCIASGVLQHEFSVSSITVPINQIVAPIAAPSYSATPDAANAAILAATDDETVKRGAASGQSLWVGESDRRGIRLDHHNWNFYRAEATGQTQPDPEQWAPGQTTIPVLASEYLQMRAMAGMSGLGYIPGYIPPALMWIT